jgi:transposase
VEIPLNTQDTDTNAPESKPEKTKAKPKAPKVKKRYPSDVEDAEWQFVVPYLVLLTLNAPQRKYDLREVFNALRYVVRTGIAWRYLPDSFPPWAAVYQQALRWIDAGVFEDIVDDLRELLRVAAGKAAQPTAVIYDAQTLQGTLESGERAGFDGYKMKNGSKVHIAVDTLGYLLALVVTPANQQERDQVGELSRQVQDVTGDHVTLAWADQGYTGPTAAKAASDEGIVLEVVRLPKAKKGFVLLPRRWVVERSFAWKSRFRRLARDYERLPEILAGLHFVVFGCLMLTRLLGTSLWSA